MIDYFKLLRAKHWIKNLFLFSAPFFGGSLFAEATLVKMVPSFIAFSLGASAVYIINDIRDVGSDKIHPQKSKRPIASGRISEKKAMVFASLLFFGALVLSLKINPLFFYFLMSYVLIQIAYSVYLKNMAIVDIFCISSGFIIRVLAGGAAFHVEVSHWLLLTMFMVSLVLASGKRLGEVSILSGLAHDHRRSLTDYSTAVLKNILLISASSSLIAYSLYTVEQYRDMVYTIPIVTFGLFRYIMLSDRGLGDPTEAITKDKSIAITVLIWLTVIGLIRYAG